MSGFPGWRLHERLESVAICYACCEREQRAHKGLLNTVDQKLISIDEIGLKLGFALEDAQGQIIRDRCLLFS
jgi:hypothetical protein